MNRGVIASLRDMMPIRPLTRIEALGLAERQALRLLELAEVRTLPVPERIVAELPRIEVTRSHKLGFSGAAAWESGRWRILINANDSRLRQRFSLFHEFKHILDHNFVERIYGAVDEHDRGDWIESVCDYFAGCVLMPRPWIKRAWVSGPQRLAVLAQLFDVSQAAMTTRLAQTGLSQPPSRCNHPYSKKRTRYHRAAALGPTTSHSVRMGDDVEMSIGATMQTM